MGAVATMTSVGDQEENFAVCEELAKVMLLIWFFGIEYMKLAIAAQHWTSMSDFHKAFHYEYSVAVP